MWLMSCSEGLMELLPKSEKPVTRTFGRPPGWGAEEEVGFLGGEGSVGGFGVGGVGGMVGTD